jgi:hypothetical protein
MTNKTKDQTFISPEQFTDIITAIYGNRPKTEIAADLGIHRQILYHFYSEGVKTKSHADALRDKAAQSVTDLRRRARLLDKFTTQ